MVGRWGSLACCALAFAVVAAAVPTALPSVSIGLYLIIGLALMRPIYLLLDTGLVGALVLSALTLTGQPACSRLSLGLVMLGALALGGVLWRDRAGVTGAIGGAAAADAMLIDLRDRVLACCDLPPLPVGWSIDTDLRSANGGSFNGDFVVTAGPSAGRLELVLVDVSGSGPAAGGRALLLAGAFEALLDAVGREQFLPAANQHLLRHGDDEGFATAVLVSLDLDTGDFALIGAGHPPAVQFSAGSGRWRVLVTEDQGPALGLLPAPAYPSQSGRLERGDTLLLYTDGLVESRQLVLERGIDRLVGHADFLLIRSVLTRGVIGAAARIAEAIRAQDGDDRALVVIRRS